MIYFTSDLHLGHANAIEFKNRPFLNVEHMNSVLIENINNTVRPDDELWILGDFAYKISVDEALALRKEIRCRHLHLIKGNHDKNYSQSNIFQSVQDYKELKTEYGRLVLFHYPILEWNAAHYGTVHLHGHIHSTSDYNTKNLSLRYRDRFPYGHAPKDPNLNLRIYDVGVDANEYCPVSLETIAELMHLPFVKVK